MPCLAPFPSYLGVLVKLSLLTEVPLFNSIFRGEPVNSALRNLASKAKKVETLLCRGRSHCTTYFDMSNGLGVNQKTDKSFDK